MPLSRLAPDPRDAIAPVMALRLLSRGVSGGRTVDPDRLVPVLREFLFEHPGAREVSVLLADYELARTATAVSRRRGARPPGESTPSLCAGASRNE